VVFDSARRAVTAAVTAQRALAAATWPAEATVRIRMGLHTTEPHLTDDGYVGVGVHRAARICEAAHGGQVLASAATAGIIEDAELPGIDLLDLGEHPLKGIPGRHRLVQLTVHGLPARFDRPRSSPAPGIGTFLAADLSGWRHVVRRLGDEASAALAAPAGCDVEVAITVHSGRWSGDPGRPVAGTALVRLPARPGHRAGAGTRLADHGRAARR